MNVLAQAFESQPVTAGESLVSPLSIREASYVSDSEPCLFWGRIEARTAGYIKSRYLLFNFTTFATCDDPTEYLYSLDLTGSDELRHSTNDRGNVVHHLGNVTQNFNLGLKQWTFRWQDYNPMFTLDQMLTWQAFLSSDQGVQLANSSYFYVSTGPKPVTTTILEQTSVIVADATLVEPTTVVEATTVLEPTTYFCPDATTTITAYVSATGASTPTSDATDRDPEAETTTTPGQISSTSTSTWPTETTTQLTTSIEVSEVPWVTLSAVAPDTESEVSTITWSTGQSTRPRPTTMTTILSTDTETSFLTATTAGTAQDSVTTVSPTWAGMSSVPTSPEALTPIPSPSGNGPTTGSSPPAPSPGRDSSQNKAMGLGIGLPLVVLLFLLLLCTGSYALRRRRRHLRARGERKRAEGECRKRPVIGRPVVVEPPRRWCGDDVELEEAAATWRDEHPRFPATPPAAPAAAAAGGSRGSAPPRPPRPGDLW